MYIDAFDLFAVEVASDVLSLVDYKAFLSLP